MAHKIEASKIKLSFWKRLSKLKLDSCEDQLESSDFELVCDEYELSFGLIRKSSMSKVDVILSSGLGSRLGSP